LGQGRVIRKGAYGATRKPKKVKQIPDVVLVGQFVPSDAYAGPKDSWIFSTRQGKTGYYNEVAGVPGAPTTIHLAQCVRPSFPGVGTPATPATGTAPTNAEGNAICVSTGFLWGMGNQGASLLPLLSPAAKLSRHSRDTNGIRRRAAKQGAVPWRKHAWRQTVKNGQTVDNVVRAVSGHKMQCESQHTNTADNWWRGCGLWAIDTANANSSHTALPWLQRSSADICCIQEMKVLDEGKLQACVARARGFKWRLHLSEARRTAANLASGGGAVGVRSGFGSTDNTDVLIPEGYRHRIVLTHAAAVCRGGLHVGSVWLRHSEGPTEENLGILQALADAVHTLRGPWVVGGDWNIPPEVLAETGLRPMLPHVTTQRTITSSCQGRLGTPFSGSSA